MVCGAELLSVVVVNLTPENDVEMCCSSINVPIGMSLSFPAVEMKLEYKGLVASSERSL